MTSTLIPADLAAGMTLDLALYTWGYTVRVVVVVQSETAHLVGPFARPDSVLAWALTPDTGGKTPIAQSLVYNLDDGQWYLETSTRQRLDGVKVAAPGAVPGRYYESRRSAA